MLHGQGVGFAGALDAHLRFRDRDAAAREGCYGAHNVDGGAGGLDRIIASPVKYCVSLARRSTRRWSRDGEFLLYHQAAQKIYALPLEGDRKPVLVVDSPFVKDQAQFSPDTRWVAYNAIDSGRFEVYVTSFPSGSHTVKVSSGGGVQPRWRSDGRELFYLDLGGRMMAVDVQMAPSIEFGVPRVLFQTRVEPNWSIDQYDVTRDGRRFFLIVPIGTSTEPPTHVVLHWRPNE